MQWIVVELWILIILNFWFLATSLISIGICLEKGEPIELRVGIGGWLFAAGVDLLTLFILLQFWMRI